MLSLLFIGFSSHSSSYSGSGSCSCSYSRSYSGFRIPAFPDAPIPQSFVMFYFTMLGYIFGIDCQTTLQVQEKLISRLPVEIYVQLRCYCCVRILGRLSGYWAGCPDTGQHRSSAKIPISRWKQRQKS